MHRYLVQVSEPEAIAAKRISHSIGTLGSHFATHADWRRKDGVSTGTLIVEADDRWGALGVIPPAMRRDAQIFQLVPAGSAVAVAVSTSNGPPSAIAA